MVIQSNKIWLWSYKQIKFDCGHTNKVDLAVVTQTNKIWLWSYKQIKFDCGHTNKVDLSVVIQTAYALYKDYRFPSTKSVQGGGVQF